MAGSEGFVYCPIVSNNPKMKYFFFAMSIMTSCLVLSTRANAQRKVGYINMGDLIALMPEARNAQHSLQVCADSLARIDGGIQNEFATKRDAFFQDSATMDSAKKEAQRKVLQNLIQQDQLFRADAKAQLDSLQQVLTTTVEAKAREAVEATAKANGYSYVLRKVATGANGQSDLVIVGPPGDDLLPLVRKHLGLSDK